MKHRTSGAYQKLAELRAFHYSLPSLQLLSTCLCVQNRFLCFSVYPYLFPLQIGMLVRLQSVGTSWDWVDKNLYVSVTRLVTFTTLTARKVTFTQNLECQKFAFLHKIQKYESLLDTKLECQSLL